MVEVHRYSMKCPKCGKEVSAAWEDDEAVIAKLPDQFPCKHCGAMIALTEDQRTTKRIYWQAQRTSRWWFLGAFILGTVGAFFFLQNSNVATLVPTILISLVAGFIFSGLVVWIADAILKDRIRKRMRAAAK